MNSVSELFLKDKNEVNKIINKKDNKPETTGKRLLKNYLKTNNISQIQFAKTLNISHWIVKGWFKNNKTTKPNSQMRIKIESETGITKDSWDNKFDIRKDTTTFIKKVNYGSVLLKNYLKSNNIKQNQFAKIIKTSDGMISHWKNCVSIPNIYDRQKIEDEAKILKEFWLIDSSDEEMIKKIIASKEPKFKLRKKENIIGQNIIKITDYIYACKVENEYCKDCCLLRLIDNQIVCRKIMRKISNIDCLKESVIFKFYENWVDCTKENIKSNIVVRNKKTKDIRKILHVMDLDAGSFKNKMIVYGVNESEDEIVNICDYEINIFVVDKD